MIEISISECTVRTNNSSIRHVGCPKLSIEFTSTLLFISSFFSIFSIFSCLLFGFFSISCLLSILILSRFKCKLILDLLILNLFQSSFSLFTLLLVRLSKISSSFFVNSCLSFLNSSSLSFSILFIWSLVLRIVTSSDRSSIFSWLLLGLFLCWLLRNLHHLHL